MEFTIKGIYIYHYIVECRYNISSKTKNILGIKREQLWILATNLVHVKTGAIIVTCS